VLEGLGVNLLVQTLLRALAMLKPPTRATLMGWRQPADALINGESLLPGAISVVLLAAGLLTTAVGAAPAPQQRAMPCPPAATQPLDGFYRWAFTTADVRGKFPSQKKRFTPELAEQLTAAFALQPSDGRFVDFDPFSNTQVNSYSHQIAGCWQEPGGLLRMRVLVLAGLGRSRASEQTLDYRLSREGSSWRIADIHYPGAVSFSLGTFLQQLLQQP